MMATVPHVTSGLGLRKFQADGYLLTRVYVVSGWTGITSPFKITDLSFQWKRTAFSVRYGSIFILNADSF